MLKYSGTTVRRPDRQRRAFFRLRTQRVAQRRGPRGAGGVPAEKGSRLLPRAAAAWRRRRRHAGRPVTQRTVRPPHSPAIGRGKESQCSPAVSRPPEKGHAGITPQARMRRRFRAAARSAPEKSNAETRKNENRRGTTERPVGGAPQPPKSGRAPPPLAALLALFEKD